MRLARARRMLASMRKVLIERAYLVAGTSVLLALLCGFAFRSDSQCDYHTAGGDDTSKIASFGRSVAVAFARGTSFLSSRAASRCVPRGVPVQHPRSCASTATAMVSEDECAEIRASLSAQSKVARERGSIFTFQTTPAAVEDGGVKFAVRLATALSKKPQSEKDRTTDPFMPPYDTDMYVMDIGARHVLLLNKFNIVENHALVVTRAFEEQTDPLNASDFAELWKVVVSLDGLGFFNCGPLSGASQPHKHMQVVPMPEGAPMEALLPLGDSTAERGPVQLDTVPFRHLFSRVNDAEATGESLERQYRSSLEGLGLLGASARSYNFLLTRRWMMVVPRRQEKFGALSINSVAFSGNLFVKNPADMDVVRENGPLKILTAVAEAKQ